MNTIDNRFEFIIVDVTETTIERLIKNSASVTAAGKKKHTIKTQVVIDKATRNFFCTRQATGKTHYFRICKQSRPAIVKVTCVPADSGHQGLQKIRLLRSFPSRRRKVAKV
ncbi:MAG: hypothetical protein H7Z37_10245 [Pyrinomonadaceae bacterium]|nr:hypothetical protein [Pyrinomonadaceae bacterium]